MSAVAATRSRGRPRWLVRDERIVDELAVEIAVRGTRPIALTRAERRQAAARILARGGAAAQIAARLHMSGTTARALAAALGGGTGPAEGSAA